MFIVQRQLQVRTSTQSKRNLHGISKTGYVMLCYVMLCCVILCYVKLCYVMLCYVVLCYVMLCYVMLCYVMLCYVMLCYVIEIHFKIKWRIVVVVVVVVVIVVVVVAVLILVVLVTVVVAATVVVVVVVVAVIVAVVLVAAAVVVEKYYIPVLPIIAVDIKAVRSTFTQSLCFLQISHKKVLIKLASLILSLFIMTLQNSSASKCLSFYCRIFTERVTVRYLQTYRERYSCLYEF